MFCRGLLSGLLAMFLAVHLDRRHARPEPARLPGWEPLVLTPETPPAGGLPELPAPHDNPQNCPVCGWSPCTDGCTLGLSQPDLDDLAYAADPEGHLGLAEASDPAGAKPVNRLAFYFEGDRGQG